ncbi:MAG: GIY-YIG nuclease family protein [Pseudohongiella sp.]|nr:GIY-YIG nuclease family protein [Pseudohongiella sp.]
MSAKGWHVYLIQCGDQSLYTGIATDVQRRFSEHESQGRLCARYLRGRTPLQLMYSCEVADRATALKLEYRVKQLTKREKVRLIQGELNLYDLLRQESVAS